MTHEDRDPTAAVRAYATDLAERLDRASTSLLDMADTHDMEGSSGKDVEANIADAKRLRAKAKGVRLALSYVEEALR